MGCFQSTTRKQLKSDGYEDTVYLASQGRRVEIDSLDILSSSKRIGKSTGEQLLPDDVILSSKRIGKSTGEQLLPDDVILSSSKRIGKSTGEQLLPDDVIFSSSKRIGKSTGEQLLPDDVIIEILLWLPVKSLLRFKCVSKIWLALIKSPYFINKHLLRLRKTPLLLQLWKGPSALNRGGKLIVDMDIKEVPLNAQIPFLKHYQLNLPFDSIFGPCNGLVCIAVSSWQYILLNPAIRESKNLPTPDYFHSRVIGEGFGSTCSNDIKLVLVIQTYASQKFTVGVQLYSLSCNSWRNMDCQNDVENVLTLSKHLFLNGVCHWSARKDTTVRDPYVILSFNLSTDVFTELEYPNFSTNGNDYHHLVVVNECLALIRQLQKSRHVEVWVMKEYGVNDSWIKLYVTDDPYPILLITPLISLKNGEWLLSESNGQLVSYAFRTNQMRKFQISSAGQQSCGELLDYQESLLSLQ